MEPSEGSYCRSAGVAERATEDNKKTDIKTAEDCRNNYDKPTHVAPSQILTCVSDIGPAPHQESPILTDGFLVSLQEC